MIILYEVKGAYLCSFKTHSQNDHCINRYFILPAISLNEVLSLDILMRSWTAVEFHKYVDMLLGQMNPYPQRNSVLVMDNASMHHFKGLREIVEAQYAGSVHI